MSAAGDDQSKRTQRRWIAVGAVIVLLVVVGIAVASALGAAKPQTASVSSALVATRTLTVLVTADGHTQAVDSDVVYPSVSGTVEHVYVALGDTVHEGDSLFKIADADLKTVVGQTETSLSQARQTLKQAQQGLVQARQSLGTAQLQELTATQALAALRSADPSTPGLADQIQVAELQLHNSHAALRSANATIVTAKASITTAHASLRASQRAYDKAVENRASRLVVAPVDGVVTTLSIAEGGAVTAASGGASALMTAPSASSASAAGPVVISSTTLKARVQVNENDLSKIKLGQAALVTFDALPGLSIPAKVSWISPNGVSNSGVITYDVDLEFSTQDVALGTNMSASSDITAATIVDALVVPNSAIRVDGSKKYVDVLNADGSTKRTAVDAGANDADYTQIKSGLKAGQRVVTSPPKSAATSGLMGGLN